MSYRLLTNDQAKQVIDAEQLFLALREAEIAARSYAGGMHWKKVGDRQYLYRSVDRNGNAKSLGVRSEETEAKMAAFDVGKARTADLAKALRERMSVQARVNAALRVGSVPNPVADICAELDRANVLGTNVMVIGTNSMHVYEAMAGVRFSSDIMSTVDLDLLWNHKTKLSLASDADFQEKALIEILQRADKSFSLSSTMHHRAVSATGYMVDLVRQMPNPPWAQEPDRFFAAADGEIADLVATDIWNMKWLLGAPRVTQPVIAVNGRVVNMTAPDPRAYAMFKIWLSKADDREPAKRERDLAQGRAVIALVEDRLPHLAANWPSLRSFPADVVEETLAEVERMRG